MKIHRRYTIFGSRLLFFALAPWLLVCVLLSPYMAANFAGGTRDVILSCLLSAVCFIGLLAAIDSWKYLRLIVWLLYLVPLAYATYLFHTFVMEGLAFEPSLRVSEAKPFSAFVGLIFWGVPSVVGASRLTRKLHRVRAVDAKWCAKEHRCR